MLRRLFVRDFAIVDQLELEFGPGFGTLTGETGAGKSILIDALSLALGERGDAGVVRAGCERAEILAEFDLPEASRLVDWLAAGDFSCEDGLLMLRRSIDASGRSRAYLNGVPATLAQLREAADFLADIHGQHVHHSLLRADAQRALLDAHAGLAGLARRVAEHHRFWKQMQEARTRAEHDSAASVRERETLEWQVGELRALELGSEWPEKWQQINEEHQRLSHAASLIEGTESALVALDESDPALTVGLEGIVARLRGLVEYDAGIKEALELLEGAQIQLQEAGYALRRYRERLDLEPRRLTELDETIAAVTALARKHRVLPEALPEQFGLLAARLDELDLLADAVALAEREAAAERTYRAAAGELSEGRRRCAAQLSAAVTDAMAQLAMAGGRFEVALESQVEPAAHGLENIVFMVSANAGQPLRPLAKVASGGELSRIGLAIQVIASQAADVPTLIFDEVDVGIGGRVAEIVGRMLHELGRSRQVLCVTHLPQVAARADWQWAVAKIEQDGSVCSRVTALSRAERIDELARMLGGVRITETTRKHAAELLAG